LAVFFWLIWHGYCNLHLTYHAPNFPIQITATKRSLGGGDLFPELILRITESSGKKTELYRTPSYNGWNQLVWTDISQIWLMI